MKETFLAQALTMGDDLLTAIDLDWAGWSLRARHEKDDWLGHSRFDLYAGAAGQLLFLLELYRLTRKDRIRRTISLGLEWLWRQSGSLKSDAFLTGTTGLAMLFARAAKLLDTPAHVDQAIELGRSYHGSDRSLVETDYIGGLSGSVMGLLYLHTISGESRVLQDLEDCASEILCRARVGPSGIYWDSNPQNVHGLCGLAHGAAGMALAWLYLGRYLKNDALIFVADQAIDYLLHHYNAAQANWSDYRMHFDDEYKDPADSAYLAGDWPHFKWLCFRNSWCNGAVGIGLVLLRAYRQTGRKACLDKALAALHLTEKELGGETEAAGTPDDILCHGRAGNAELFLEAHRILADDAYYQRALRVGECLMSDCKRQGGFRTPAGQPGLFTGLAGIGYFFCRLADPEGTPPILCPELAPISRVDCPPQLPLLNLSRPEMRRQLLIKAFPRTLTMLAPVVPGELDAWLTEVSQTPEKVSFTRFVDRCRDEISDFQVKAVIGDVFNLETTRLAAADSIDANGRLCVKQRITAERLQQLRQCNDADLEKTVLGVDPDLVQCKTRWDWSADDTDSLRANLSAEGGEFVVLLLPHARGMREVSLSPLSAFLVAAFASPAPVRSVLESLARSVGGGTSLEDIRPTGLAQIRALLEARFLVDEELAAIVPV